MAYEPLGNFSSGSSFDLFPQPTTTFRRSRKRKQLTVRQFLAIQEAQRRAQHRSFGDRLRGVGKGALGGATWALTQIMRPSWAVTAATSEALGGKSDIPQAGSPFEAAVLGLKGDVRKGFGQILGEQGVLKGHRRARGIAGFGLDVATDPTMWVAAAATPVTGGGSLAAYTAAKEAGRAITPKVLEAAAREAGDQALKGGTDDILKEILKSAGPKYSERAALVEKNQAIAAAKGFEEVPLRAERNIAASQARAEQKLYDPTSLGFRFGTSKHGVSLDTHLPLLKRPGAKIAEKNVPILSQLVDFTGRVFKPGFRNEVLHAGEIARKHVAEHNAVEMATVARRMYDGVDLNLNEDHLLEALHYFEQPLKTARGGTWKAMVKDAQGTWIPNPRYEKLLVDKGYLNPSQIDFIRRTSLVTERFNVMDKMAGVEHGHFTDRTGRMYFPHILKSGEDIKPTIYQKGYTTAAGFQHGRDSTLSLLQIKQLVKEGKLPRDVETNPYDAITRRARAGAEKQADQALINTLKAAVGVPSRLVNQKSVARAQARLEAAHAADAGAAQGAASAEKLYHAAIATTKVELHNVHDATLKKLMEGIKTERKKLRSEKIAELEGKIKRARKPENKAKYEAELKRVKRAPITNPKIAMLKGKAAAQERRLEKALTEIDNPRTKAHAQAAGEWLDAFKVSKQAKFDAAQEIKDAQRALKKAMRGRKNPLTKGPRARGLVKETKILDEYGNHYFMPSEASNTILRLQRFVAGDDKTVDSFARAVSKWMGAWKILVTTVNPGYRIRNTMTDLWNMWLAGVPAHEIGIYGTKAARMMHQAKDVTHPNHARAMRTITEAAHHGILSGLFAGDVQAVAQMLRYSGSKRGLIHNKQYVRLATKVVQDFNKNAENWGRLTHYLYQRQALKKSAADAAEWVKMAHFDYEDLTPTEQKLFKNIMPFYTWTRKNIPYQVKMIVTRPGRYAAFPKAAQETEYATGNKSGVIPGYAESNFAVSLGGGKYYMPQFGVSDLSVFQGPGEVKQRIASLLGPQFKIPAEVLTGKSLYTGQDIAPELHSRVPFSGRGAGLLSLIPGANIGQTSRIGPGGKTVNSPGMDPWFAYALGQLPGTRTAFGIGAGTPAKKQQQLLSWAGGQYMTSFDPQQQAYYDKLNVEAEVDKMMQDLRDQGTIGRRKRKKSYYDKLIQSILDGSYGSK